MSTNEAILHEGGLAFTLRASGVVRERARSQPDLKWEQEAREHALVAANLLDKLVCPKPEIDSVMTQVIITLGSQDTDTESGGGKGTQEKSKQMEKRIVEEKDSFIEDASVPSTLTESELSSTSLLSHSNVELTNFIKTRKENYDPFKPEQIMDQFRDFMSEKCVQKKLPTQCEIASSSSMVKKNVIAKKHHGKRSAK